MNIVLKFRMAVPQSRHGLSFEATECMVRDRLSWMRVCWLEIADTVPPSRDIIASCTARK
ncbi:transposase [Sagittula marina]|uniref:transposase n=1 Tax=Sagittula marina TaxID=943940 RepID=UPI003CCE2DFE